MSHVKCSVSSCGYYKNQECYIETVNIAGKGAQSDCNTCCGSFLSRHGYSNIAEYTSRRGAADTIKCNVNTCKYNESEYCSLDEIQVGGNSDANIYTETECTSYSKA